MTPLNWQRIEAIIDEVLELDEAGRRAYLDEACGDDHELRSEVESLLAYESKSGQALADAIQAGAASYLDECGGFAEGERIGVYRVIREIGRGGMGTVYLAQRDDDHFQKQVAIKLVTRGMDTGAVLARFRRERQILARLEHPYIARLLDGGSTADGRPYLVMEYVEGQPVTTWCAERRCGVRERVELFRKVCAAVQSAHQNLVVHRDLKPGNILVDASGTPKLLDFGIAKLLMPEGGPAATVEIGAVPMFTPDYASPEQVQGEAITTASDVYSLGAILYELLAGSGPHRLESHSPTELDRVICRQEPVRPSSTGQVPAGDLDNVVLMALQKEPARRYVSAAEFSEDLHRYLEGLPVRAREDTLIYRSGKFVRRHRAGVVAAILLVASLAGGVTVSTIQARRAERRFSEVRRMAHAVLYDIYDSIRDLPGSVKAREIVVNTALRYLDGLVRDAAGDPGLQLELAEAYERVADVQGDSNSRNLGNTGAALKSYRKALEIADNLASARARPEKADLIRMRVRMQIGLIGGLAHSPEYYNQGIQIGQAAIERGNAGRDILRVLSELYLAASRDEPDSARGLATARKGLALLEKMAAAEPVNEQLQSELADQYSNLASRMTRTDRVSDALAAAGNAVRIREALVAAHPLNVRYRRELMIGHSKVGDACLGTPGYQALAIESFAKALKIAEELAVAKDFTAEYDLAMALGKVGQAAAKAGDHDRALPILRRSHSTLNALLLKDPKNVRVRRQSAFTLASIGTTQTAMGDIAGAVRSYRESISQSEAMLQESPADILTVNYLCLNYQKIARLLATGGQRSEALEALAKSLATAQASRSLDASNPVMQSMLPLSHAAAGDVMSTFAGSRGATVAQRRKDWTAARDGYQEAAAEWEKIRVPLVGSQDRDAEVKKARAAAARCAAALSAIQ
jgi:eukaryotic-like serine/threonine-protein kinase